METLRATNLNIFIYYWTLLKHIRPFYAKSRSQLSNEIIETGDERVSITVHRPTKVSHTSLRLDDLSPCIMGQLL
jgi:hypothetical protein